MTSGQPDWSWLHQFLHGSVDPDQPGEFVASTQVLEDGVWVSRTAEGRSPGQALTALHAACGEVVIMDSLLLEHKFPVDARLAHPYLDSPG